MLGVRIKSQEEMIIFSNAAEISIYFRAEKVSSELTTESFGNLGDGSS